MQSNQILMISELIAFWNQWVNEFQPVAEKKGLQLNLVNSSASVRSDSRLLLRIIRNFISNAIRYTGAGRVLVGCRRIGGQLKVQVWDTGVGIPEEKQKLIFKEFQQLHSPIAKERQGVGLGLAIVDRIATMLGHSVTIQSTLGKGSVFSIELPLASAVAHKAPSFNPEMLPANQLSNLAVLVIDNEEAIQESMAALLKQWGCLVLTASSGEEAISLCDEKVIIPEVILADYHLDHEKVRHSRNRRYSSALQF